MPDPPQGAWVPWRVYTRDMDRVLYRLDRLTKAIEEATIATARDEGSEEAEAKQAQRRRTIWLIAIAAAFGFIANITLNILTILATT